MYVYIYIYMYIYIYIYIYIFIFIYIYICFIDSRMLCTIVNKKIHFISEKLIIIV